MIKLIFWIVIALILLDYLQDVLLIFLNNKASKQPIPTLLEGLYDKEKYNKQQAYARVNRKLSLVSGTIFTLFSLFMFAGGGIAMLDRAATNISSVPLLTSLLFLLFYSIISRLIDLPISIYKVFGIEQSFGFNKVTPRLFVMDKIKGFLLSMVMNGVIFTLVILIYQALPDYFWLLAWGVMMLISLCINFFYSEWIVPLFNKQTPLPEGELRTAIESFAQKANFPISGIYVIDGSKRSTKANAYFTGFGRKKRIVLYDTLIDMLSTEEIVAVLAHEAGHNHYKHTIKNMTVSMLTSLLMFYLLGLCLHYDEVAQAAGCTQASFHVNLTIFGVLYTPISIILGILGNIQSRHHEYQADNYVWKNGYAPYLISGLKKLAAQSLSNLTPHPLCVFMRYSHPTLYQRIVAVS